MKTFLIILLTAGVTFAAARWLISGHNPNQTQQQLAAAQAKWESEKNALESALAEAKGQPAPIHTAAPTAATSSRLSPADILKKLVAIKPGAGTERNRNIRLVVFHLESLRECGPAALPVIRDFFALNQDIDYTTEDADPNAPADQNQNAGGNNRQRGGRGNNSLWSFRRGGELRTDFVLPPSLRLGLVDVVRGIGGADAEQILATVLETTGRGIEVAYVAKSLEEMSAGKYREAALASAKDLLAHPSTIDSPNSADNLAEGYLFDVLRMYNDTSFAANAQAMLIGADGRVDRNALDYLNSLLKEQAIPALYQAYNNSSLTNQFEKARIARDILAHAGENSTANQLLTDIVNNKDIDARMRGFAVMQLGGGFGGGGDNQASAATYSARIPLVDQLLATATDQDLIDTLNRTRNNLLILATNGVPENPFGRGGNRGNRGNRGGQGGQGGPGGG